MFLAQITFGTAGDRAGQLAELKDTAETYLVALYRNGQIYGSYFIAWSNHVLIAYSHVLEPNALAEANHSQWGHDSLRAVELAFGVRPELRVIDDELPTSFRSWKQSSSLFLFTHAFDESSVLVCGDTGVPLPVYQIPADDQTRDEMYSWAGQYRDLDRVWLSSGALEIPAYKQLADPESELSKFGRKLASDIERVTGRPTYYYLMRYWGRSVSEESRPCPACGGQWCVPDSTLEKVPFHRFAFRCQRCRLVSHVGATDDDQRRARIGEFRRKKRRTS